MNTWRCVLIVYREIDLRLKRSFFRSRRFAHTLPQCEIDDAIDSFSCFPSLVSDLTSGAAEIHHDIVYSKNPLITLSRLGESGWWPSPGDTRRELEEIRTGERYDSVFILWPQNNLQSNESIESGGWGLGMRASPWSMNATYATVANADSSIWNIPVKGEVWLHEWLHGACAYFAERGYEMPDGDADGGDRHGYVQCPETGWTAFYRDLMNGRVVEKGKLLGIPSLAWRTTSFPRAVV